MESVDGAWKTTMTWRIDWTESQDVTALTAGRLVSEQAAMRVFLLLMGSPWGLRLVERTVRKVDVERRFVNIGFAEVSNVYGDWSRCVRWNRESTEAVALCMATVRGCGVCLSTKMKNRVRSSVPATARRANMR